MIQAVRDKRMFDSYLPGARGALCILQSRKRHADLICTARYRFRNDDPRGIPTIYQSRKVGFQHVYAQRISTSRRFSSLTKFPITLRLACTFFLLAHKNFIYISAVIRIFLSTREARWNSHFDFDVEFTEREMRKLEWVCLHVRIWTTMPLCGSSKQVSRHLDIGSSVQYEEKTRRGEYAADERPIIYFLVYCELHFFTNKKIYNMCEK